MNDGPGFRRMKQQLGPKGSEELRQQVLREQVAMAENAERVRVEIQRDREAYRDYPKPKGRKRK